MALFSLFNWQNQLTKTQINQNQKNKKKEIKSDHISLSTIRFIQIIDPNKSEQLSNQYILPTLFNNSFNYILSTNMGSGNSKLCPCQPQIISLIHLSDPTPLIRSQIQRQPGSDIRTTRSSFIRPRKSEEIPKSALILGCKLGQNRHLLNKYLLTYLFFIKNKDNTLGLDISKTQLADFEIRDFTSLLTLADTHNQFLVEISQFQENYISKTSLKDKADFLLTEYFKDSILSSTIEKFPIYSTDPTILGYLRRPIIDLHSRITSKYRDQEKKKEIYCVIQIPKTEEQVIQKMAYHKNHLTFSTFVRCFSNEQKAKARFKTLRNFGDNIRATRRTEAEISTIFLTIIIQKNLYEDYDYGFLIDQSQKDNPYGDIIMNILNFFQVSGSKPQDQEYDLKYGSLAKLQQLRRDRLMQGEPQLLAVMNVIKGQCEEIKTHSSLIRHIAERSLSITASKSLKMSELGEKAKGQESINLIEAYLQDRKFDQALEQCQGKDFVQFKVRKAQILYEANRQAEAQLILGSITPQDKKALKKNHFKQYILCEFISSKIKKRKGDLKQGKQQLKSLIQAMRLEYEKSHDFEYRGWQVVKEINSYSSGSQPNENKWQKYWDGLNVGVLATR